MKALIELRKSKFRVVGTGEVIKVLRAGNASHVFVATDAEMPVVEQVLKLCRENNVSVIQTLSMKELGAACGIQVEAASAALLKEGRKRTKRKRD